MKSSVSVNLIIVVLTQGAKKMTDNEELQARLSRLEKSFADLSDGVNEVKELIKSNKELLSPAAASKKMTIEDLYEDYVNKPFSAFYKEVADHREWLGKCADAEEDIWDKSCYDEESSFFARVVGCLMYFDVGRIARYAAAINFSDSVPSYDKLSSRGVKSCTDSREWEKVLTNDVGELICCIVKEGEADADLPYKHWQVGRLHLVSSIVTYIYEDKKDVVRKLELYWTPESSEAGNLY